MQLGLVNLAMGSIDKGRVELEDELRVVKTQTRTFDPELEGNLKVIEDLQMIVDQVDSDLHQVEAQVHHRRTELELERKKWEFHVKDVTKEYCQMEEEITRMRKHIAVSRQINEEEVEHMGRQLENLEMKAGMSERVAQMREEDI